MRTVIDVQRILRILRWIGSKIRRLKDRIENMSSSAQSPAPVKYFLEQGYIFLATRPTLISGVAGSCVAVCIYDRRRKIGGMSLFQYPVTRKPSEATARFGNIAVLALIRMMTENGSSPRHMEAQILGGAHNPEICTENIGRENVRIARRVLTGKSISVASEDVGGGKGRKIIFNTQSNEVAVIKVDRLRRADWFPYENNRTE